MVNFWAVLVRPVQARGAALPVGVRALPRPGRVRRRRHGRLLRRGAAFLDRYGVRYPNVRDPDTSVLKDYGGLPIPRTYVIGRDWVVSGYIFGETREETLRSAIEEALAT